MAVLIKSETFNPMHELSVFEASLPKASFGATASFTGTMRDYNEGQDVCGMVLEHYPEMTEKQLHDIIAEARSRWDILDALIVHRVGEISPGDPIVLTAVCSAHRSAAFDACRFLMEELKTRATFWKKETLSTGDQRWVEKNTPG